MRTFHRLTDAAIRNARSEGFLADGGNLFLQVTKTGARSWILRFRSGGKRHDLGLGSARDVPLAEARKRALSLRRQLAEGVNPIEARRAERAKDGATFGAVAMTLFEAKQTSWRSSVHRHQWIRTLEVYGQSIWNKPVDAITVEDVLAILTPIWVPKSETANRVRARVEAVLDAAQVRGLIPRDRRNPGSWRGMLAMLLPKRQRL